MGNPHARNSGEIRRYRESKTNLLEIFAAKITDGLQEGKDAVRK
jgi:hypothetical protein